MASRTGAAATLASPLSLRGLRLRNRVVAAPMERNYSDLAGRATPRYADYLAARAAGGTALLFTEASYVRQDSKARLHQAGMHDDAVLPGLENIARAVHAHGALLGVEINHAGRVVPSAVSHRRPVGPSAIACTEIEGEIPRELGAPEIDDVVAAFASAASRAVRGGADVVSVHGGHGYLIGQFVSPRSNNRTDRYSVPTTFLDEVLVAVREAVGDDVPVFLRWSAFEGIPGGLGRDDSLSALLGARLDLIDVVDLSAGTYGAGHWITPSGEVDEGYLGELARRYRRETGLLVSVAGRITRPESARALIADGAADMVSVARALHADPRWTQHAIDGTAPRPCIACNQGCADVVFTGRPLWCSVNPATGREGEHVPVWPTVRHQRAVLVAGSGPAGLQAALTLARAGLRVIVAERDEVVGGQLAMAADLRAKPQFGRLLRWYRDRLSAEGVTIDLGREVSGRTGASEALALVDATGGADYVPAIDGPGARRVAGIRAWWRRGGTPDEVVTIWGADRCGVYVADQLASWGRDVVVVARQPELAPDAGARERLPAVERLVQDERVSLVLNATLERVLEDELIVSVEGVQRTVPASGPVLASLGCVPRGLDGGVDDVDEAIPVVTAGEAAGLRTLDDVVASGERAAHVLLAHLTSLADRQRVR